MRTRLTERRRGQVLVVRPPDTVNGDALKSFSQDIKPIRAVCVYTTRKYMTLWSGCNLKIPLVSSSPEI